MNKVRFYGGILAAFFGGELAGFGSPVKVPEIFHNHTSYAIGMAMLMASLFITPCPVKAKKVEARESQ